MYQHMDNGKTLEEAGQLKYLDPHKPKTEHQYAHSAMTRQSILWIKYATNFPTKTKLYKSLVLSMLIYG